MRLETSSLLPEWASPPMRDIYDRLHDEESRYIFAKYAQYFLFRENRHRQEYAAGALAYAFMRHKRGESETSGPDSVLQLILDYKIKYDKLILYPAGRHAAFIHSVLTMYGVKPDMFCDRDPVKQASPYCGCPVISPEALKNEHCDAAVLVATYASIDVNSDLWASGLYGNGVTRVYSCGALHEAQYFGPAFMQPVKDEIFVDVGVHAGQNVRTFMAFCTGRYRRVYGMESHAGYHARAIAGLADVPNVRLVNKGAWSDNGVLVFHENAYGLTSAFREIIPNGRELRVDVMKIDDLVEDDPVTLMVMDIEGAEREALKGAERAIREKRPRLAISIYHLPDDFLEIPRLIMQWMPDCRFYIRQHALGPWETVFYAVPNASATA